ncbi:MAG: hypothetical protein C5B49_08700 [Bdellovibrio sp.]|nr:MAG: hypothetical protein C5B49_08700 [Bdellovibrio sp.]
MQNQKFRKILFLMVLIMVTPFQVSAGKGVNRQHVPPCQFESDIPKILDDVVKVGRRISPEKDWNCKLIEADGDTTKPGYSSYSCELGGGPTLYGLFFPGKAETVSFKKMADAYRYQCQKQFDTRYLNDVFTDTQVFPAPRQKRGQG